MLEKNTEKTNEASKSKISNAFGLANEVREIAADDFHNVENVKADEVRMETKLTCLKSAKFKKARLRAIEANNKHFAKKQRSKLNKLNRPPMTKKSSRASEAR